MTNASSDRKRILVVDDEDNVRESLKLLLGRSYDVSAVESGEAALKQLTDGESSSGSEGAGQGGSLPDLVLVDVMMPGLDGLGLLEQIHGTHPTIPVIMLTASNGVKSAVQAMKSGAVDYVNKPFDVEELLKLIDETLQKAEELADVIPLRRSTTARSSLPDIAGDFGAIVGRHPVMQELYRKVDQLAHRETTVLITGESGTGKELIAKEIHRRSARANGPFIALNCAAIPETLIESELFGHEKGAFTHAIDKRIGHFELADGGTLFLDEIGELSAAVQVKILRFLQEHEFYRIGRSKPQKVDVRVLAATNKSLETAIREGSFRQDLYYRINVVNLEIPPLRSRSEDVSHLVSAFVKKFSPLYGGKTVRVSDGALDALTHYSWPGNVRELENVTESILALSNTEEILLADLPLRIREQAEGGLVDGSSGSQIRFEEAERQFETELILKALKRSNYVQTRAAELLGISRRILKYKMDKLGISDSSPEEQN